MVGRQAFPGSMLNISGIMQIYTWKIWCTSTSPRFQTELWHPLAVSVLTKRSVPSKKRHGGSPNPTTLAELTCPPKRNHCKSKGIVFQPTLFPGNIRECFFSGKFSVPPFFFIAKMTAAPGGIEAKSEEATLDDNAGKQKNHQGSFHATRFLTIFFPHPES